MDDTQPDVEATEEARLPREERRNGFPWTGVILTLLVLLTLYPLSLGPALWLYRHDVLPNKTIPVFVIVYTPLEDFIKSHQPGSDIYLDYLRLWVPDLSAPT